MCEAHAGIYLQPQKVIPAMIELTLTLPAGVSFVSLHFSDYNKMYHVAVSAKRDTGREEVAIGVDQDLKNAAYIAVERLTAKLTTEEYDPRHWVSKEPFPKRAPKIDVGELDL